MCTVVQFREYDQWTSLILFFCKNQLELGNSQISSNGDHYYL